jgi:hypothetical protein
MVSAESWMEQWISLPGLRGKSSLLGSWPAGSSSVVVGLREMDGRELTALGCKVVVGFGFDSS